MHDAWPETVNGWELARHDQVENYRKRLANNVTVTAIWENGPGTGRVTARVEPLGIGRTLTSSRQAFTDKTAFWTAAQCVVEMAANLPSLGMGHQSTAESALCEEVAGTVEAEPGSNGTPEAELTFTLVSGRTVTLILSDEQAFDLTGRIDRLDKYAWSEQREDEGDPEFDDEDIEQVDVPDVTEVQPGPDTGHDVVTLLDERFGVPEDHLMAHVDWSALIVVGESAVGSLIERSEELHTALQPRWYPVVVDRPGERWVVLRRIGVHYLGEETASAPPR